MRGWPGHTAGALRTGFSLGLLVQAEKFCSGTLSGATGPQPHVCGRLFWNLPELPTCPLDVLTPFTTTKGPALPLLTAAGVSRPCEAKGRHGASLGESPPRPQHLADLRSKCFDWALHTKSSLTRIIKDFL